MRKNKNLKHLPLPQPSLLPRPNFSTVSLPPPTQEHREMGNGGLNQFILFLLLLPPQEEEPILCPSVGSLLSHEVQFFSNQFLQCGSPMASQVLTANPLQCVLLSPQGHVSFQEPALVWASHGLQVSICSSSPSSFLLFTTLEVCRVFLLIYSHSSPLQPQMFLCHNFFFPFLNTLSLRCYHCYQQAQSWPAAGVP